MANEQDTPSETPADENSAEIEAAATTGAETNEDGDDLLPLLEDARAKADEHWNQLLRVQADLENTRKRAKQDVENAHKFALEKFALELLPVKDSLEMGLSAIDGGDETVAQFKEGVELTLKMLTAVLEKFGIEAINPEGDSFDPTLHQAMSMQESSEHQPNTVMAVMQKGYQLNDRLLRPAMVVVSKAASEAAENETAAHIDEQA